MVINIKYHCFNDVIHFHLVRLTWPIMRFFCSLSPLKQKSHLPVAVTHNPPLPFSRIMDRGGIGNTRRRTTQRSRFVWPLAAFVFCFVLPHVVPSGKSFVFFRPPLERTNRRSPKALTRQSSSWVSPTVTWLLYTSFTIFCLLLVLDLSELTRHGWNSM